MNKYQQYLDTVNEIKRLEEIKDALRKDLLQGGPGEFEGFGVQIVEQQRTTVSGHEKIKEIMGENIYGTMADMGLINRSMSQILKVVKL